MSPTDEMVLLNDSSLWQPSSVSPEKATTFQGIERGFTCFGMFCNLVLLPLIMFKSPTDMGVYKFLMVYIAVFELFFGWLELMTVTNLYTQGSLFTVVVDPDEAFLPDGLLQISCLIYCGSFATSLAMFGVQFAYRYQVLKGQQSYPISLENKTVGFVAVYFYPGLADGSTTINWDSFIGMSLCTCILFGSESLMLYFALKSYLVTKSLMTSAYSANFQKLQWQLFYALVSQAVIPIFFMQIPLSAIYITLFANISTPFFGHLQELTISFYLATDALPTIFIIKPYREFIFSTLRCLKLCKSANSANQVGTHTAISLADIPSRYIVSS